MMDHMFSAAIDIGGTFTDTALKLPGHAGLITAKNPTTQHDPTLGALEGLRAALSQTDKHAAELGRFIHGTTLATNALIERRGAQTAVVTTQGFRDILEIAYERRYSQYDIMLEKPDLIVPRSHCYTVKERMNVHGEVVKPLQQSAIEELLRQLNSTDIKALAICLLHSYANPSHEQALRDEIHKHRPDLYISLSSEVSPEAREFERLCTTVANAYLQPLMVEYLTRFEVEFKQVGLNCPILMMTSSAGMTTLETARKFPIRLVESGPSGGAIMAARVAQQKELEQVLSFDMGGTTAKLCLINQFTPKTARNFEINRAARFIKGSGMPVRIPVVEMIEIGAGGGSYAGLDRMNRITIGPESAGSDPGPAGFDRGGTLATVTDSDICLAYIDPSLFAEQRLKLNKNKAQQAVDETIGTQLELNTENAAYGISQIVDENMASAGRMHAVESGMDIASRTMIAFGGNGPLHATRVARRCGVNKIVIPVNPGVGSAVGFLDAPVSFEIIRSHYTLLQDINIESINKLFLDMLAEAKQVVRLGAPDSELTSTCSAFMRYHGQGHEIEITLDKQQLSTDDLVTLKTQFEQAYAFQYSRIVPNMEIEILNWAVKVTTHSHPPDPLNSQFNIQTAQTNQRRTIICDLSSKPVEAAVFHRQNLQIGDCLPGPALVIEPQTTTLVSRDFNACIDSGLNIILTKKEHLNDD